MKQLSVHITFFYKEDRLKYLIDVINSIKQIEDTDIFIHTNKYINIDGCNTIIHNIQHIHPFFLSWCSRKLIRQQVHKYKFYMYIEDDVLFSKKNFEYYLKYHKICAENNSYLGFFRVEQNKSGKWFFTDLIEKLHDKITLKNITFYKSNKYRYSAMWILDDNELTTFVNDYSDLYQFNKLHYFRRTELDMVRENAAIGPIYEMFSNMLVIPSESCYMHHIPNNYADDPTVHVRIPIDDIII